MLFGVGLNSNGSRWVGQFIQKFAIFNQCLVLSGKAKITWKSTGIVLKCLLKHIISLLEVF